MYIDCIFNQFNEEIFTDHMIDQYPEDAFDKFIIYDLHSTPRRYRRRNMDNNGAHGFTIKLVDNVNANWNHRKCYDNTNDIFTFNIFTQFSRSDYNKLRAKDKINLFKSSDKIGDSQKFRNLRLTDTLIQYFHGRYKWEHLFDEEYWKRVNRNLSFQSVDIELES